MSDTSVLVNNRAGAFGTCATEIGRPNDASSQIQSSERDLAVEAFANPQPPASSGANPATVPHHKQNLPNLALQMTKSSLTVRSHVDKFMKDAGFTENKRITWTEQKIGDTLRREFR